MEEILDSAYVCHLGFVAGGDPEPGLGPPIVLPTMFVRVGSRLYVHGSPASRMLRSARRSMDVCVTVTHLDGLVYARSAFHHSMNYRSVVVLGRAVEVVDTEEKLTVLRALVERFGRGRWDEARKPTLKEFSKTVVLAISLDEASAKIRSGPPVDDEEDLGLDVWAGVVPLFTIHGEPEPDPSLPTGIPVPAYLTSETVLGRQPS
ncbi:MAG: pyridoxamine 5'-phosphate oxidase family protein [Actinobacteria bacterium]|nr:pyridoxamine 5'-phosphate oxidase family protein [Actinomycetota bacterium]